MHLFDPNSDAVPVQSQGHGSNSHRRTRVLIVSGTLSGGGAERFASTLLQHLNRTGFDPSLCLFRDEIAYPLASDVDVSILGHRGPMSSIRTVRRLSAVIDHTQPDVVMSTMDYLGMFVGEALKTCRVQPAWLARTSNNPELQFNSLRGRYRKLWLKRVYPRADMFVANSSGLAESFQRVFVSAGNRTRVVLNPVDIGRIENLSKSDWFENVDSSIPNLFSSARLRPQKRPDVLIEAFRLVLQHSPGKLWMCGDGPMRGKIEDMIEQKGLRPHVRLVGFRENIFPLLKSSTVAIATSDYEGLPNNLLEAQALGIPVVSTRSSFGPEEIIEDGRTGLLAECGNPADVANAVIQLLNNRELRIAIAARARDEVVQRFGLDSTIPVWESLLLEVAAIRRPAMKSSVRPEMKRAA